MPSNGQPSFLLASDAARCVNMIVCQCPLTGNHHFYNSCVQAGHAVRRDVSMPSNGQPSFLPKRTSAGNAGNEACQCPLTGNHHFYIELIGHEIECHLVSMPSNGQPSFLQKRMKNVMSGSGCQCPLTGNHHFYPTPQNILILCGFPATFFGVVF